MIYRFDHFVLDAARFELRRKGEMLAAEPQVLSLLILLVESRDRLVTKEELIERVWKGRIVSDAAVTSRIKSARQLLGDDGRQQRYIRTIHGKGLRFVGDVEESEPVQTQSVADTETAATPGSWQQQRVEFCTAADGTGLAYSCVGDGPRWSRRRIGSTISNMNGKARSGPTGSTSFRASTGCCDTTSAATGFPTGRSTI